MQSNNKANLLGAISDERKRDPALLISTWLLWYSLSDNSSPRSENLLVLFFPFCSPLWELEDKIASITTTAAASFRLSKQSLYLQHHASLVLSRSLAENFDGSFVLIWGPRANGDNVIATSFQRATCDPRPFERHRQGVYRVKSTAFCTRQPWILYIPTLILLCFVFCYIGSPWKLTRGYNYSF